ncbi:MAG: exodeoxyribonuclease III [Calditrichaceae bacterium]
MRLISWNVNGVRAAHRNGFMNWFTQDDADIVCLQEVKATSEQVEGLFSDINDYKIEWNSARTKAGYSGVATFSRVPYAESEHGFGIDEFDNEGRIILQEFEKFYLYNIYFPNGQRDQERLDYKMRFYDSFLDHAENLRKTGKAIISCGDFNTAHKEIDLANPKANENTSGFLPIERAWLDKFVEHGYVDTFREKNEEPENYSWWTYRFGARQRNIGWRLDYFFIDREHALLVKDAFILNEVMGSDHCPVGIEIDF